MVRRKLEIRSIYPKLVLSHDRKRLGKECSLFVTVIGKGLQWADLGILR
jgi:hypothetical protein